MRIFDIQPDSRTEWHDHHDGTATIAKTTDVTATLERAKALHNERLDTTKGGQKHVASIPIPVLVAWAQKHGKTYADMMQDQGLMHQFLTDPDNSHFRIWKGRL